MENLAENYIINNDNYKLLISKIPQSETILLKNCGIGQVSLLCALVRKNVEIYTHIENEDDFLTAANCVSVPDNLHYINDYQQIKYDTIFDCDLNYNNSNYFCIFARFDDYNVVENQ